jgi:hypothetical protein
MLDFDEEHYEQLDQALIFRDEVGKLLARENIGLRMVVTNPFGIHSLIAKPPGGIVAARVRRKRMRPKAVALAELVAMRALFQYRVNRVLKRFARSPSDPRTPVRLIGVAILYRWLEALVNAASTRDDVSSILENQIGKARGALDQTYH